MCPACIVIKENQIPEANLKDKGKSSEPGIKFEFPINARDRN